MYHNHGGSKLNTATQSQPLQVTRTPRLSKSRTLHRPKHKTYHAGIQYSRLTSQKWPISSCPFRQPPLQVKSLPRSNLKIPASAAYLNSQLRADLLQWPVSLVIVSADHRYNAGGLTPLPKKIVRPQTTLPSRSSPDPAE